MNLDLDDTVVRNDTVLSAELDEETVLMSIAGGTYYGLSRTSEDVWRRLAEPVRVRDLCAALAQDYDAPIAMIEADTLRFLDYLLGRELIAIAADGGGAETA